MPAQSKSFPEYNQLVLPLPGFDFETAPPPSRREAIPQRTVSPDGQLTLRVEAQSLQ